MDSGQIVRFEPLRSLAFGSISGTYTALGTPLANASHILNIDNLTDADVLVSFDGITDHTIVPAGSGKIIDYASDKIDPVGKLLQPQNTQVYIKQASTAATVKAVYLTTIYGSTK